MRAQILAATVDLVARHGVAGFRYEQVAELAGVHKASVYRNWPDRDKLVSEALIQHAEDWVPLDDTGELREDLVNFLMGMAAGLATPTGRAILQAMHAARESADLGCAVRAFVDHRVSRVQERVDRAVERGELPPVDCYFLAEMLSGPVHLYVNRGIRPFTREVAERITDVVLAGVRETAS